jgi:hypothetical protein
MLEARTPRTKEDPYVIDDEPTKPASPPTIQEYPLGTPGEHNNYRLFPAEWDTDPEIFFHGTESQVRQAIFDEGFSLPPPDKAQSVSFSRTCNLALSYACEKRSATSPDGVVIAVRFGADNKSVRAEESFGIHVTRFNPQPEIIGYCIVPGSYSFR